MYIDIYFYDHPSWEGDVIRRITGTRFTHVVPGIGEAGLHVDTRRSRWLQLPALHKIMPPLETIQVPVKCMPLGLIEDVARGSHYVVDLAAWYRNRERGLHRDMPWNCVEATRLVLMCCGVSVDRGTPDEIYEQLRMSSSSGGASALP